MNLEEITNYAKQYGFIFQGSEIYGGLANSWDYGPLGVALKENIKNAWWKKFVQENPYNYGISSAILMNPKVWEATGHVSSFTDPLIDCKKCKSRYRADKVIEDYFQEKQMPDTCDGWSNEEMSDFIDENKIKCPTCGSRDFTDIRKFNLLFETQMGVTEGNTNTVYLRPETAQGIFVNYSNIQRSMRLKLPFGVCQVGKSFRNEITPGNFIFRTREFEQMELEFFCKPGTDLEWYGYYKNFCLEFLKSLGLNKNKLRYRDHTKEELAFYSVATTDIEYEFPFGWGELWGIADRTDYDLRVHSEYAKVDLSYLDPETNERYIPYCVEPSVGLDRLVLTFLCDAYKKETLENGEERELLKIHPYLAPIKATILPLVKKVHNDKAYEIYAELCKHYQCSVDESGSIGKRYRRADAIGTPYVITVDDETLEKDTVTVRNRDTMEQIRISVYDLKAYLDKNIEF
ncbi:MAG: glycine--tRNA ligase [Mollicutes bacterium]|jgi:glycyl-tRNA synthetase|nr:glycine--tRNA ligase [Mollicutes bacterium]